MSPQVSINKPVLFVGESGTAKTVTIQNFLGSLDPEKYLTLNINFSSRTSSRDVQTNIEANVDKRSGRIYGPPVGKKLIIFVDDLNMPRVDTYGTQQPIALLHFLVGRGCMYDRSKDLEMRTFKDMMFVGAMGPPGGGRNRVDPRFVNLYTVFNLTPPTREVLSMIYGSILKTFLSPFPASVLESATRITTMTLKLYDSIIEKLPATPSKFHYIFNLRDLGRVYEGMCLATTDVFASTGALVRLWRNEVLRVFGDRLISETDNGIVSGLLEMAVKDNFPGDKDVILANPIVFGDYKNAVQRITTEQEDVRLYQDLGGYVVVRNILDSVMEQYNFTNKVMQLVLFEMALSHLTRIHRIIRMPRGNALLVGVGGSGKQSLTRLAAFTAGYRIFEISLSRNYGETEFREDLKTLYKFLGKEPVVFLFTDAHVLEEGFLELINNMLTTGMVPALYEPEERDGLANSVRAEARAAGWLETKEQLWSFYVNRCRNNLHLVLAMSPSGETLRRRCRNFPGLVSNTVIDWFFAWPEDALTKVAAFFLEKETFLDDSSRPKALGHMVMVHLSVVSASKRFADELRRYNYVTPKNYLDYIANYKRQVESNSKRISTRTRRLEGGLTKLTEAQVAVDRMSGELREKKVIVDAKTVDCEAMIKDIGEKSQVAETKQVEANEKKAELEVSARTIAVKSEAANVALGEAEPALAAAASALDDLNKEDISEIKAFASPPPAVMNVCICVLQLRPTGREPKLTGKEDDATLWKFCKGMMSDTSFLASLKEFAKDDVSEKASRAVKKLLHDPDLNMTKMPKISKAGAGLLQWVIAIIKYNEVAKNVQPLKDAVKEMEKAKAKSERELTEISATLATLTTQIAALKESYERSSTELTGLREQATIMERRLTAASRLILGLGSERARWSEDIKKLTSQAERLVGDCVLSAAFLSYAGAFTFDYRQQLVYEIWAPDVATRGLPTTQPFSIEEMMTDDATVQKWVAEGLPADQHSVMNGILTTQASRFPLCIDPQQQAVNWIKAKEKSRSLICATLLDGDFMKQLELAVQYGKPFLFENVDEDLDPMIDPILEKNTYMEGSQRMIKLGDKVVEWDAEFRLYLTSKLANPHYSPEVMGKTMIINYSVTMQGLENQLLNVVVGHERPDLEEQFRNLVSDMSANTQLLVELENTLLQELANSSGNILDNAELIAVLEEAKRKSVEITAKLEQSRYTKADINKTRENYKPAAKRGSILFFAMSGLSNINKMYEISLAGFLLVFRRALLAAKKDPNVEKRLKNMVHEMTMHMYESTCTGIFERHKLMFSFQMTIMIADGEGQLNRRELDFFLKGDISLEGASRAKPFAWMSDQGWKDLLKLQTLSDAFSTIVSDLVGNVQAWKDWYDLETPETEEMPLGYSGRLSVFQKLLVYRCFRVDRVYNAVKLFVMRRMGDQYVQPPVFSLPRIFKQSTPISPVVFVLSPGADPASDIQALGVELGFSGNKFKFLALGQGQASTAEAMLEAGYTRGLWILLQNCHLLLSWLKTLEKLLLTMSKPHPDFRLWLTTDPTDRFPLGILQRSLKVVTEPPDGLKLNMRAQLSKLSNEMLEECPHKAFRPLVYTLCFLHAVVLERRKYGKIGWNVSYDFNESDFNICRRLLNLYLTKAYENRDEMIPWGSLKYLIGDAMYGGRVSDDLDRRVLVTYLHEFMGDFLFDEHQHFYFSRLGFDYDLPEWGPLDSYINKVESLPLTNGPAVFGLHPNAEIGYFTFASKSLWTNIINLQPRATAVGGGVSREEYIQGIVRDVQAKIPQPDDVINLRKKFMEDGGAPTPTQVVLLQVRPRPRARRAACGDEGRVPARAGVGAVECARGHHGDVAA